ncbi:MAG: ubiquinone biosynthesis regulatory protein kinase UbiB [Gammaproteobacteria bacterium]|nr:ubiquinone biosynthesis regulatory protein kinase UbiB [Gammaproteobacteria bacterium]
MIHGIRQFARLLKISAILSKYRLDEFLQATHLYRPMRLFRFVVPGSREIANQPRGARLRMALQEMGPIYVKFGQIISTRRDLVAPDIADELALLQDQVPPFPGEEAQAIVEKALGNPVAELFGSFTLKPLASASIAQVHEATLPDDREVVVKVVRPGIRSQIRRDIDLLMTVARLAEKYWEDGARVKPPEFVREFEMFIFDELDMTREASNASVLRQNFKDSNDLYVPEIYWDYTKEQVLVMERIHGVPISDVQQLREAGVNMEKLAKTGIRVFYTQVFRDNLFHADMHPGNIYVDISNPENPTYIALDFGIVASLTQKDLYFISENFLAMFNRDYYRVALLHQEAGWVPHDTRLEELEAAIRAVGEPAFSRPLNEISFGELMLKLIQVAYRFKLDIQPQLIMLQKTLLNIEGLGRELFPELDVLAASKPELERILREKHGLDNTAKELRERLPGWLAKLPDMPGLLHDYLKLATDGNMTTRIDRQGLEALRASDRAAAKTTAQAVSGGALFFSGTLMAALETGPWTLWGVSSTGLLALVAGAWLMIRSMKR